jgi:hypothetical protein
MRALINVKLPQDSDGSFFDIQEFRNALQTMRLKPLDIPSANGAEGENNMKEYFLARAEPIFHKMPETTEEEKARKEFSRQNIVYASDLPRSNSLFMVTAHTEGEYRFRLLNPKIEELQDGCEDLIIRIREYNEKHRDRQLTVYGKIRIFEHGLEESTISGSIVHKTLFENIKTLASRELLLVRVGLIIFLVGFFINFLPVIKSIDWLSGLIDRFSTALLTTAVVSGVSIYHTVIRLAPVIQWTASYDHEKQ